METKRLFIGTFVDEHLFGNKYEEVQQDFRDCCGGKWVETENLHFTYQFLGDVDTGLITEIKNKLKDYLIEYKSKLIIRGLSALPKLKFPRIIFAKIRNDDHLVLNVQKQIEAIMTNLDFQPDKRDYIPHLTLLRVKYFDRNQFVPAIEKYGDFEFGIMNSFRIDLIESILTKEGPIYKKI
jgi:2'-5' RNA ligase